MTVFQQFRLWARRAPVAERATAFLGAALAVAVLVWLVIPPNPHHAATNVAVGAGSNSGTGGPTASAGQGGSGGQDASGAAGSSGNAGLTGAQSTASTQSPASSGGGAAGSTGGGSTGGSGGGSAGGGGSGSGSSNSGAGSCVSPPGTDQGVSSSQIKIAIILIQIVGPAANSTFGIPDPSYQQAAFQDVINSINASGGAACRKLVPVYYIGDPADQAGLEQLCQTIIAA
jgi:hypothetical protein